MAVTETDETPEERFDGYRSAYLKTTNDPELDRDLLYGLVITLRDMSASLDAEVGRLTDELRTLQGARS